MSLSIQFYTMLTMIGMGAFVGAALDTYQRFLKRSKRHLLIVFMNDIFFWIVQAFLIFYVLLKVNEGDMRVYVFIALLCGFALYMAIFQSIYHATLERMIIFSLKIMKILRKLFRILILLPLQWIFHVIIVLVLGIYHFLIKVIIFFLKIVQALVMWPLRLLYKLLPKKIKSYLLIVKDFLLQVWNKLCNLYIRLKQWMKKN